MTCTGGPRGVSLIEALVALAVMAFGVLGVVGVQLTLRTNADVAKQRAEAVRIAQEAIETWRAFSVLTVPSPASSPAPKAYADVQTTAPATVTGLTNTNTTFTIASTVVDAGTPPIKALQVDVTWNDRNGNQQRVTLFSNIAGILPEVSGALAVAPKSAANGQVLGRNGNIPVTAVDNGNGTSSFSPPGSGGATWVFNNSTGLIVTLTAGCSANPVSCVATSTLLSGYIRFWFGTTQPTDADAANPPGPVTAAEVALASQMRVRVNRGVTSPTPAALPDACYTSVSATDPTALVYYCSVPFPVAPPFQWSGWSELFSSASLVPPLVIAPSTSDVANSDVLVCRYTPAASNATVVPNVQHPQNYVGVATSLRNQNFFVMPAGDNTVAFTCPAQPGSLGNTLPHQPF